MTDHNITGACISQFDGEPEVFELLVAYADGREIGYQITRAVGQRIAAELNNEFGEPAPKPAVQKLDWVEARDNGYEVDWRGKGAIGTYAARAVRAGDMILANGKYHLTLQEAQASCQADYEHRVLSALTTGTVGTTSDGVDILTPSVAPKRFTEDELNAAISSAKMRDIQDSPLARYLAHDIGCAANDLDYLDHTPCTCGLRALYNPKGATHAPETEWPHLVQLGSTIGMLASVVKESGSWHSSLQTQYELANAALKSAWNEFHHLERSASLRIKPLLWKVYPSLVGHKLCATDCFGREFARIDLTPSRGAEWIFGYMEATDEDYAAAIRSVIESSTSPSGMTSFQKRVSQAHHALFHDDPTTIQERRDRNLEEALETAQAFEMTKAQAHDLVEYTFGHPAGEPKQEIGAQLVTLASLCVLANIDMMECAEADLEKLQQPENIARIRAKRATRHGRGVRPGISPDSGIYEG